MSPNPVAGGCLPVREAAGSSHVLRPLVALTRIRHSPERHDFGFRQAHEDLPPELVAELESLAWPAGPEALPELLERESSLFERTLAGLELD